MDKANQQQPEPSWNTYIANYEEGKAGITTLRMDLMAQAPFKDYPYLLVVGFGFDPNPENGFPKKEDQEKIYEIDDHIIDFVDENTDGLHVGSFTFDGKRLSYFYLTSANDIDQKLESFFNTQLPGTPPFIDVEEDKEWESYVEFLYPDKDILRYMADRDVVMQLEKHGDDLETPRRVDHWSYFKTMDDVSLFSAELLKLGFEVGEMGETTVGNDPYKCQFWRDEKVELMDIHQVTSELRVLAEKFNGVYDGWETRIIKPG